MGAQPRVLLVDRRHRHTRARIRPIAFEFGGHVHVDHIPGLYDTVAGDAVCGFIVQADAGVPRKLVRQDRRGARVMLLEKGRADVVELFGRHARLDVIEHVL